MREASEGGWLRISDDSVKEVGIETVLAEKMGSFMLFYERVLPFQSESLKISPRSSQETVTPHREEERIKEEESDASMSERLKPFTARIVRSVSVGNKSREGSIAVESGIRDTVANGTPMPAVEKHANGSSDPASPKPVLLPNGPDSNIPLTTPPESLTLSTPTVPKSPHGGHHSPRNLSPARTVDLVA